MNNWADTFPAAITVADIDGKITYMNDKSADVFKNDGGLDLLGRSLFDCHSDGSNEQIRHMLDSGDSNCYTIEKNGKKKLIYQSPYFENGQPAGIVEISIELPENMPHFVRKP